MNYLHSWIINSALWRLSCYSANLIIIMRAFYQIAPVIFRIVWIASIAVAHALGDGELTIHCIKSEEEALLKFKQGFENASNLLSSWSPKGDCCKWKGVGCNSTTGHVISLHLPCQNPSDILRGKLSSSLLDFPYLTSLDLSGNDFLQAKMPEFLGYLNHLEYLNLSEANFKGILPNQLGNLSQLQSLNLSNKGQTSLRVNNFKWLHGLSSLKLLDLSGIGFDSRANEYWYDTINQMPSLVALHLSGCQLRNKPPFLPQINCDSFLTLDLSFNYLDGTIPKWLFEKCRNLNYLDISNNQFHGQIPDSLENLTSLLVLRLSNNNLSGPIPSTIGQTTSLKELHLSNNHLSGTLNKILVQLSKLVVLDVSQNELEGIITDTHLGNLSSLKVLLLTENNLILNVSKNWVPPFQLTAIGLGKCLVGPEFPRWIQTQKNLSYIDLSNANIFGTVPKWFWDVSPRVEYLDLSLNYLRGWVHDLSSNSKLDSLDLSYNFFSGPLPHLPPKLRELKLAENSFYGHISHVCDTLGVNNSLSRLDLHSNNLSGNLPNCWNYGNKLVIVNLRNNSFSGSIPDSFGSLTNLYLLSLRDNELLGNFPLSMKSLTQLTVFDLGGNRFSGNIPTWISQEFQNLQVLILRSNTFEGSIPVLLCQLKSLRILDLSFNHFSGPIPRCVFPAMATKTYDSPDSERFDPFIIYKVSLLLTGKGVNDDNDFERTQFFMGLDLSSNFLTGDIPAEMFSHVGLRSLNLSRNQLVGSIPSNIDQMLNLEFLDLSRNQLSCSIPASINNLTWFVVDVSYNSLSGEIPLGTQIQSFDSSSFIGNPKLCGSPLTKICSRDAASEEDPSCKKEKIEEQLQEGHRNGLQAPSSFCIGMIIGFITGFWGFWVPLLVSSSWRHAYYSFLEQIYAKVYVMLAIIEAKLKRKHFSATHQSPI